MAYFHTTVLDEQIKALPTVGTASGSIATFDTDMTENLIEVICDIQYQQASGTPSPDNPLPITTYTSLNLSHSGADTSNPNITNIPFGQTVAKGTLNVITGVLEITHGYKVFDGSETFTTASNNRYFYTAPSDIIIPTESLADYVTSSHFVGSTQGQQADKSVWKTTGNRIVVFRDSSIADLTAWYNFLTTQYNNGTPVQLIYELATPLTIQLSATQITALLNENNIWCDTNGDTEVKYILSVGKAIS